MSTRFFIALLILLGAVLFFAASNWFFVVDASYAYAAGIRVDYLLVRLFALDFVGLGIIGLYGFKTANDRALISWSQIGQLWRRSWQLGLVLALFVVLLVAQFFSELPVIGTIGLLRMGLAVLAGYSAWQLLGQLTKRRQHIVVWTIVLTSAVAGVLQTTIALLQYMWQQSVAGYWFFGESTLSGANIAKAQWSGAEYILGYGTTAHPNILAGILAVYAALIAAGFLVVRQRLAGAHYKQQRRALAVGVASVMGYITLGILLTHSVSGMLTLVTSCALLLMLTKSAGKLHTLMQKRAHATALVLLLFAAAAVSPTLMNILHDRLPPNQQPYTSIHRRAYLGQAALTMFTQQPIIGVGVGQFSAQLQSATSVREAVRFVQPAHSVPLVWLAETGIIGVLIILLLSTQLVPVFLLVLPSLLLDHYWLTQPHALVLLCMLPAYMRIYRQ